MKSIERLIANTKRKILFSTLEQISEHELIDFTRLLRAQESELKCAQSMLEPRQESQLPPTPTSPPAIEVKQKAASDAADAIGVFVIGILILISIYSCFRSEPPPKTKTFWETLFLR